MVGQWKRGRLLLAVLQVIAEKALAALGCQFYKPPVDRKHISEYDPIFKEPPMKSARADGERFFTTTRRVFAKKIVFFSRNLRGPHPRSVGLNQPL